MKKVWAGCLLAVLLLLAQTVLASPECYTLEGGDYYGGDMLLSLTIQSQVSGSDTTLVLGTGTDSQGGTVMFVGSTQSSGHIKEFSLQGNSDDQSYRLYSYHLTLGPGEPKWIGTYQGKIRGQEGEEKDLSGSAIGGFCP